MPNEVMQGIILTANGGLYTVETPTGVYECRARGIFRKKNISPSAGDNVTIQPEGGSMVISEIGERKNFILRPPLANLDRLFFVCSTCEPYPSLLLLDKFIAVAEYKGIEPIIVFTKVDKIPCDEYAEIYKKAGFNVIVADYGSDGTRDEVMSYLQGGISAFTGNTGVGKSTLLNFLDEGLIIPTAEISKKLGRGRHTTRQVSLYKLKSGGYVADTPGFSSFDTQRYDIIRKDDLAGCFREFAEYSGDCRFPDCAHIKEKGCAVTAAVERGDIAKSRHDSYTAMYEEAKQIKDWEIK